jgi:predicted translin family RNA/ssDNA-binding protein
MSNVSIAEARFQELTEKEKKLEALLTAYPELQSGQKLTPTAKRYKEAFAKFVERTDQVLSSAELVGIFQYAYVHGYKYTGPSLHLDIAAAKKQLGIE